MSIDMVQLKIKQFNMSRVLTRTCDLRIIYHSTKFLSHRNRLWSSRYNGFNLPRDLARPSDLRATWLHGKELHKVSYHPAMFGGHRYYVGEDICFCFK